MNQKNCKWFLIIVLVICSAMPSFSQEILATFGIGYQIQQKDIYPGYNGEKGITVGVNILFLGRTGFTISTGVDTIFDIGDGAVVDPIFGLGYVYYNKFYIGGIFNVIPRPYTYLYNTGDVFISPTIVAGYDFGSVLLGCQISSPFGVMSSIIGFKFSFVVGINVNNITGDNKNINKN